MPNIREIAKLAGVSRSTASLVLNNSPLVKKETKERVLEVIRQTKYVPNNNARNLSRKIMNSLGIIVLSDLKRSRSYDFHNGTGLFSLNVIQGITSALTETDYSIIIEYFHEPEAKNGIPKLIRDKRIDGAFILGGFCEEQFIDRLNESGVPFVVVAVGANYSSCDSVVSDPSEGAYSSVRHLMKTGHKNIGFINCPRTFRSSTQRVLGVSRIISETGAVFDSDFMMYTDHNSGESGYQAMKRAYDTGKRFDAIAAANPQIALGAMRYLQEQGIGVPDQVSFLAYEDNSLCGYSNPPLTAINIQKERMGEMAARILLERIADPSLDRKEVSVDQYLVIRNSIKERKG